MSDLRSEGYLLRATPFGESDLVIAVFTEAVGKVSALIRGGRASRKRVGGALEPFHTAAFDLKEQRGELWGFKSAEIVRIRSRLTTDLERMDHAGTILRALRALAPPRTAEPRAYETLTTLLDAFDEKVHPSAAVFGAGVLELLSDFGYALELSRCVSCGTQRPPGRTAVLEAFSGGVVCATCRLSLRSNAKLVRLSAEYCNLLSAPLSLGQRIAELSKLESKEDLLALHRIGELALAAHGDMEEHR
ncbi:MAG: DNA repair protein RecO [Polyangiaceae bacterium]